MRKALIKFQGEDITTSNGSNVTFKVKEELVNTTDNEEAYYTRRNFDSVMEILVMTEVILLKGGDQIGLEEEGVEVEGM